MFGFLKNMFGKKDDSNEKHYDPNNISVRDLRKGWIVEYDLQTWEAVEEYEYDWGHNSFTYEFKLVNGEGINRFLYIEEDDELIITVSEKLRFSKLDNGVAIQRMINDTGQPPQKVTQNGIAFYLESESPGHYRNIESEDFDEFISWEYWDDDEQRVLSIEQWGPSEFEASIGVIVPERAFSNILPNQQNS